MWDLFENLLHNCLKVDIKGTRNILNFFLKHLLNVFHIRKIPIIRFEAFLDYMLYEIKQKKYLETFSSNEHTRRGRKNSPRGEERQKITNSSLEPFKSNIFPDCSPPNNMSPHYFFLSSNILSPTTFFRFLSIALR